MRDVLSALTSLENQSSNVYERNIIEFIELVYILLKRKFRSSGVFWRYVSRLRNFLLCNIKDCQFTGDQKCVLKCSWCCELFSDYSVLLSLYKKYFILVCLEVAAKLGSSKAVGNNRPSCHLCDLHLAYTSLHHFCLVLRDGPHDHRFPHSVYGFIEKPNCKSCTHILKRKVIPLFWGKGKNPSGLCDDHVSSHEEKRFRVFKKNHSTLSHLRKWIRRSESSSDSCDSYSLKGENKPVKDNPLDCLKAESIPHQRLSPLNDSKCIDVNLLHSYIDKHLTTELPQPCLYPHVLVILCKYINAIQFIIHMDESYSVHYGDALAHFNINILEELQNVTKSVYEMFISTRDDFYLSVVQIVCQAITVVYDCLKYWKKSVVHLNYDTSLLDFITLISQWFHSNESKFMPLKLTSLDILLNVINLTSQCTDVYNRCHNMIINFLNNIQTTEKHIHELLCMTNDFNSNVHSEYIADYFMCLFHKLYQSDQSLLQHTPPPPIQDSPCIINKEFPYLFVLLHSFVSQSKCLTVDENTTTTTNTTPPNTYALVTYRSFLSFMHNHALSICSVYMLNEYFVQWIFDMLFELYFSTSSFIIFNHFKSNNNNNNELRNHLYFKIIYAFLIDLVKKEKFAWLKDVLFKLTRNDNSFVKKTSFLHELCQIHNDIITALISTRRSDLCYANIILNDHLMQNFLTCLFNQINTADSCLSSDYYPECAHNLLESYTILLGVKIQMLHSNKFSMSLNFWQDSLNTAKDIKSPNFLLRRLVNMLTMPWNRPSLKFSDHNQLSLIQEHEKLQSYLTDFTIQLFSDVFNQSEHLLYTSQFIGQNKNFDEVKFIWQLLAYLVMLSRSKWCEPPLVIQNASKQFLCKLHTLNKYLIDFGMTFINKVIQSAIYYSVNTEFNLEDKDGFRLEGIQELRSLILPPIIVLIEMMPHKSAPLKNNNDESKRSNDDDYGDDNDIINQLLIIMVNAFSQLNPTLKSFGFDYFYTCLPHLTQFVFCESVLITTVTTTTTTHTATRSNTPATVTDTSANILEKSESTSSEQLLSKQSITPTDSYYFDKLAYASECESVFRFNPQSIRLLVFTTRLYIRLTLHNLPLFTSCSHYALSPALSKTAPTESSCRKEKVGVSTECENQAWSKCLSMIVANFYSIFNSPLHGPHPTEDKYLQINMNQLIDEILQLMACLLHCSTIRLGCLELLRCLISPLRFQPIKFCTDYTYPLGTLNIKLLGNFIQIILKDIRKPQTDNSSIHQNDSEKTVAKRLSPCVTSEMFSLLVDWIQRSSVLNPVIFTTWPKLFPTSGVQCDKSLQHILQLYDDGDNLCSHVYSYAIAYDDQHGNNYTKVSYDNFLNMLWPSSIHSDDESLNQAKSISSDIPTDSTNHIISDSSNTVSDSNTLALSTWICLHGRLRDNKPRPKFTQLSEMDLFHHVECNHLQHLVSLDMKREYSETGSVPECQSSTEQDDSLHSASNSTNNLSLQIWISSMYACIYLRMVQCSAENRGQIILLGDLCLDFPIKKKIHQQWNHLFLFIQWFDTFNAKVYLIINGWFECIGDLSVDKDIARRTFCQQYQCTLPIVYYGHITDNYSLNCRKYYFQLGNLFLFAGIPSIDQWTIYSSKGFFRHNRKSHHNDDSNNNVKWIAMSFTLLGPCWTGCFDSIECGSRYRNYATCILQALVRRYASAMNDVGQLLSQILLKTNSLITSKKWLHFVKVSCSENLFIMLLSKNSSFLQFIMPVRRLQASTTMKMSKCSVLSPTEIIDGDDYDHNDNGDAFILCDIYNIHHSDNSHSYNKQNSSKSYRNEIYAESISRKRLWTIKKLYASSNDNIDHNEQSSSSIDSSAFYFITHFDASFEPHGGIEVPIHLLGELVCQSHDVILIADCLKLLFTMLQNSSTMFAQFHTPALSHPGTEIPIEKYSKVWLKNLKCPPGFKPAPLSFGHCLLARLFKHPHFNTTLPNFYMIMEVLFNQIVFKFTNSNITSKSKQQYLRLFIDPGLLRCILLFSPRTFWYPPVEQSPEFSANHFNSLLLSTNRSIFKYGLIPGIFEILMNSNEMYSSDSIIITLYNLYTLDKWQLIMASVTGFREAFLEDNPATGEAVVINQQVLAQYTQNWPIQTLTNFIKNRLSLLVIGGINEVTTGKSAESVCDYRFHAKGDKNIIRNGRHFEYISGFLHSKRSCLLNLCRSIISLDANMYLSAAEKVFYTIHDDIDDGNHAYFHQSGQRKQTNTTKQSATTSSSSKLNDNWIFWHQTTRKCLNYSERLKVWRYLSTAEQPATSANSMTNRKSSLKTIDDSCMANETIHSDILDTGLLSNALDNNYESVELQAQRHLQFSSEDEIKSSVIKSTTDTMKVISDSGVSISSLPDSGVDGSNPVKSGNSDCDLSKDTTSVRINETGGTNKPSKTDYTNERLLDCVRIRVEQNAELSALLIKCLDDLWHKCFPIELLYKKYMKNKGKPTFSTIKMENEAEKRTMAGVELSSSSSSSKCRTAKERRINILKENFYQSNDWYSFEVRSNYALLSNVTDSSVSSTGYALIRPPLWLIYSLFRHPNLSLRESALSGYCVWLHFEANKWIKRCKQLYKNFNQSVYFDCSPPTNCTVGANTKAYTTVPPHLSRVRVFTTGLLSPTSPLWCVSDSNMKTDFKLYNNRHLCSVKLLNRAFGLILHGSGKFTAMNEFKMMSKEQSSLFTTNLFMVNNTCSLESLHQDETGFISEPVFHRRSQNSSNDHTSRRIPNNFTCTELSNSDNHNVNGENECKDAHFHKYYLLSTFPVLYSLLIGCFVDAILSCIVKAEANSTNQQYSGDNDNNTDNDVCDNDTTSEIELCTNGLNVLIIILQDSDKCILSTAVKSGLLPVVFNLAWLLEFGVNKVNALEGNNNLCIVPALMPILTSLSRLASRITSWLLMDEKFTSPNDRVFRFQSVVAFVKHLIAMNCVLSDNDAGDNNTSETTTELQLNPGPVSRCLVRRVLYSILETSTNHLDKVGNQIEELFSQENENKEKENNLLNNLSEQTNHLREELKLRYDQLKWILNCIVNVLIYSAYRDEEMIALMTEFSSTYEISSREFSRVSTPPSTSQLRDQNEITYRSISRTFAPPPTSRYSYPYHDFVHSEQYPSSNILRHSTHLPPVLPSSFTSSSSSSASSRLHNDMLSNQKIRTYLLSTKGSNSFLSMQQSLEQALVTSMFTTALQIKNSVTLKIPKISNFLTTNDFMNLFTKSLSRILISRTQLPEAGVSVDFLVTYLLKLFNEETGLLNLCLAVLPPMYSPTFWSNLISVQYWLSRNVKPMSTFLTNISSSNQNINNSNNINDSVNHQMNIENATSESCLLNFHIVKQLTQLHNILNALLTVHFNADSSTLPIEICQTQNLPAYSLFLSSSSSPSISLTSCVRSKTILVTRSEIFTYRELIIIAYRKAKDQWKISLSNLNEAMNSKLSIDNNDLINHDKKSILDQLIQMFWSKSTSTKSNLDDDEKKFAGNEETPSSSNQLSFFIPSHSRLPRKFSIARLAGQARKQCVEGHNAWMDAYSERRRIVGPLGTILWARLAENISHNRGLFYHPESSPSGWCVDPVEGSLRQHYRFYYTHLPIAERLIHSSSRSNLSSNRQPHCLASLIGLPEFNQPPPVGAACTWSDLPLCLPLPAIPLIQLASASRYHIKAVWACRLVGLLHIPPVEGDLVLGQSWLRFQPDPVISNNNNNNNNNMQFTEIESLYPYQSPSNRLWFAWSLKSIDHIEERRYSLRDVAVEIFPDETDVNTPMLFAMQSTKDRDNFIKTISPLIGHHHYHHSLYQSVNIYEPEDNKPDSPNQHHYFRASLFYHQRQYRLKGIQQAWINGELSNFAYLMELNSAAGRSYNDLMQYPIFPWIIRDYESTVLDLTQPTTFRLLNRPIAIQDDERAKAVAARFNETELELKYSPTGHTETISSKSKPSDLLPPYHYPAHCSNEAIVLHYLIRLPPYTFRHLRFQDNNFDVPDRLFHSVATTWRLVTTSVSCVKELVPEFYFQPEVFINRSGLKLGYRQPGDSVDCVELPPWCKNDPRLFTLICRAALESDYVSMNLSHWIDLLFGFKQTGENAKNALNLYHPYTYFGAIDVDTITDPLLAQAVEAMISNYGQTPKQLFRKHPHPYRQLSISNEEVLNYSPKFDNISAESLLLLTESHENDDRRSTYHSDDIDGKLLQTTFSSRLDNTPLETVIGLKWGTWAGSPQVGSFELFWKKQLIMGTTPTENNSLPFIGHLTGSVWCEFSEQTSTVNPNSNNNNNSPNQLDRISSLTCNKLYHSWDGWVDFNIEHTTSKCLFNIKSPSSLPSSSSSSLTSPGTSSTFCINNQFVWYWKILLCESTSRLWISLLPDVHTTTTNSNNSKERLVPYLIKLNTSSIIDNKTVSITMKRLNKNSTESDNPAGIDYTTDVHQAYKGINLQLPYSCIQLTNDPKDLITSLAVSPCSSQGIQLFIGTCFGSIYARQLPINLMDISDVNGWLPQNYQDISVWNTNNPRVLYDIKKRRKKTKININYSKLLNNNNNNDSGNNSRNGHSDLDVKEAGLWEITGWKQLIGHTGCEITVLVINRNNSLIASGDDQGQVCLWDRYRLSLIKTINTNICSSNTCTTSNSNSDDNSNNNNNNQNDSEHLPNESACNPQASKQSADRNDGSGEDNSNSTSRQHSSTRSSSCNSPTEFINTNNDSVLNNFKRVDGICFSLTSGELVIAKWNYHNYHVCWLGVYSCSGVRIATRILDFMAEINDSLQEIPYLQTPEVHFPVPMAFSSVSEGRGVNCLLIGGPGGRLVWLNSWTLDTVRTYLLPNNTMNSRIISLCFGPLASTYSNTYQLSSKDLGEILCQGLYVLDQTGCLYHFGPKCGLHRRTVSEDTSLNSDNLCKQSVAFWLNT